MPCCLAIIQFSQCQHKQLWKLGCTSGCDSLCAPDEQKILILTRYQWRCESCQFFIQSQLCDERSFLCEERFQEIEDDKTLDDVSRGAMIASALDREEVEDKRLELRRLHQIEEIQHAEAWTRRYGWLVWELAYGRMEDPGVIQGRLERLRRVRPWDLVAIKDATRSRKELLLQLQRIGQPRADVRNTNEEVVRSSSPDPRAQDPTRLSPASPPKWVDVNSPRLAEEADDRSEQDEWEQETEDMLNNAIAIAGTSAAMPEVDEMMLPRSIAKLRDAALSDTPLDVSVLAKVKIASASVANKHGIEPVVIGVAGGAKQGET